MNRRTAAWTLSLVLSAAFAAHADDEALTLVSDGAARCVIVRGEEDAFAAARLQRWFLEAAGVEVPVVEPDAMPADASCVLSVGSASSNRVSREVGSALRLDLDPARLTSQGYVTWAGIYEGRPYIVLAGGGRDGTLYAVTDLFNWRLDHGEGGVRMTPCHVTEKPALPYRWFWNWDHRMDWGGPGRVGTLMGGGGAFSKEPEAFLIDFKRCVDYMADHKYNGLIIWGFLRDTHGGIEASQELCRYASERGVRILPGVGTSGYAGYYFEGDHPYNADTWLREHPELRAITASGQPHEAPCPSKKANQEWLDEGARWLFDTFDVGGVNLEMGDFFVCHCDDCKQARAAIESDEPDYYKDMAISHSVTLRTMREIDPEAWLSYATYTGYTPEMTANPPKFAEIIPEYALCQWTLTGMARKWPGPTPPPTLHNIGYLHWCNRSTHTEEDFYLEEIQRICANAFGAGFEGLDTYGELSPDHPNVEIFYLGWEAFLWNPGMSIEDFVGQRLGRLYGGPEPARKLVDIIPLVRTAKQRAQLANLTAALDIAVAARAMARPEGVERWDRLIAYVQRHAEVERARTEAEQARASEARRGQLIPILSVSASDEDPEKKWTAANAIDGNIEEPAGYWLTRYVHPERAWIELQFVEPAAVNRVALYHQLDAGHYRSRDYRVFLRVNGAWQEVAAVEGNTQSGWVTHDFPVLTADGARIEITRSEHGNRMGMGEVELRFISSQGGAGTH